MNKYYVLFMNACECHAREEYTAYLFAASSWNFLNNFSFALSPALLRSFSLSLFQHKNFIIAFLRFILTFIFHWFGSLYLSSLFFPVLMCVYLYVLLVVDFFLFKWTCSVISISLMRQTACAAVSQSMCISAVIYLRIVRIFAKALMICRGERRIGLHRI